jgi:phage-related minor tail protein
MSAAMDDTREKVIRLEAKIERLEDELRAIGDKVGEMHTLLLKAQGAKWGVGLVLILIGAAGGTAASYAKSLLPLVKG